MKSKKKLIITAAVVAAVGLAAFIGIKTVSGAPAQAKSVSAVPLSRMELANTVSVTGTVKSEDAVNVYSTLAYQVMRVDVEVGDTVTEGQVLCELDTADLQAKIDQQAVTLNNTQSSRQHNLTVAQKNYETAKRKHETDYDTDLLAKQNAVTAAERNIETRQLDLQSANNSLRHSRNALKDYVDNSMGGNTDYYDPQHDQLRQAVSQNQIAVDKAQSALADAKKAVEDRKFELNAFLVQREDALVSAQDNVKSATLSANMNDQWMAFEELKKDLDKAVIKAPISGTVTAVMATEGGSGQGLLFVIEDTSALRVDTKIEEYDLVSVEVGQMTKIKSDGTGDDEYVGKVTKIAPTAVKAANGTTVETTDVQFVTEIGVTSKPTRLRIGMNARLEIVTQEKKGVFAVSYDAVIDKPDGGQVVFVARQQEAPAPDSAEEAAPDKPRTKEENAPPVFIVKEIPVTTGMETDFYIEIISDALHEGDLIVSNPTTLADGDEVALEGFSGAAENGASRSGGPGGPGGGPRVRIGG